VGEGREVAKIFRKYKKFSGDILIFAKIPKRFSTDIVIFPNSLSHALRIT
jgi:hypothetical protein